MADTKISALPPVTIPAGTDLFAVAQGGASKQESLAQISSYAVPLGVIVLWSGTIATIPVNWALCNGTANAPGPDLRDKFIVGAKQDDAGVAKSNIEGSLKVSSTATGASIADHSALSHTGGSVADHTGLSHDGAVASHPDLTHAALSHPAITVVHADHSVASGTHSHASGADVSVPSGTVASALASRPSLTHSHASRADLSTPSGTIAAVANISVPSQAIASGADVSVPSQTGASAANASAPSGTVASTAAISVPGPSFTTINEVGSLTRSLVTTGGLLLTIISNSAYVASHSHASLANASGPSGSVASTAAVSVPSHSHASDLASRPSLAVAAVANASAASGSVAAAANASMPSLTGSEASGVDVSVPSGTVASSAGGSRPSLTGSGPAVTLTHADHSLASLSHQAIGTHGSLTHSFTPPASHGTAGTLTHAFTEPAAHAVSAHGTVGIVPAYYALAYIQRMS